MPTPIFQLIRQIDDDNIGLRVVHLVTKLGTKTVEELANYSRKYVASQTMNPEEVVSALGTLLEQKYGLQFSETYSERNKL